MSSLNDRCRERKHRTMNTGEVETLGRLPGKRLLYFKINWERGDLPKVMWKFKKYSNHTGVGGLPSAK